MQPRNLYDKAIAAGLPMAGMALMGDMLVRSPHTQADYQISLADVCVAVIEGLAREHGCGLFVARLPSGEPTWRVSGKVGPYYPTLPLALAAACDAIAGGK